MGTGYHGGFGATKGSQNKKRIKNTNAFFTVCVVQVRVLEMIKNSTASIEISNVHTGNGVHNNI